MIDIGNILVTGGEERLFSVENFRINERGICLILGPNGSGKTCFFRQLSRQLVDGKHLGRNEIGHISAVSAYDRSIPLTGDRLLGLYNRSSKLPDVFEASFGHLRGKSIREMSSGEFQCLVLIAQLLTHRKVYLFDEPFSHLNPSWIRIFVRHIEMLSLNAAFFIVCHHVDNFQHTSTRRLVIQNGGMVES